VLTCRSTTKCSMSHAVDFVAQTCWQHAITSAAVLQEVDQGAHIQVLLLILFPACAPTWNWAQGACLGVRQGLQLPYAMLAITAPHALPDAVRQLLSEAR
jgi:hypothetical protein